MTIWKVLSWVAKGLAWIWIGLILLGLFGKLYLLIAQLGLGAGFAAWLDWFDPTNPINVAIHVIELLPAFGLLWLATWLGKRSTKKVASSSI